MKLLRRYHPDIAGDAGAEFSKYLNEIHDVLSDDVKRADYDRSLKNNDTQEKPSPQSHHDEQPVNDYDDMTEDDQPVPHKMSTHVDIQYQEPRSPRLPWSMRFISGIMGSFVLALSLVFLLSNHLVGKVPVIPMVPNMAIARIIAGLVYGVGLCYLITMVFRSRFSRLAVLITGAIGFVPVMSMIPGYHRASFSIVVWSLITIWSLILEVVKVHHAKAYEIFDLSASGHGDPVYMVMSMRNDGMVLLEDAHGVTSERAVWGKVEPGYYVTLGNGNDVTGSLPFSYAEAWVDVSGRPFTSRIFNNKDDPFA
jgi:hypothetical protein